MSKSSNAFDNPSLMLNWVILWLIVDSTGTSLGLVASLIIGVYLGALAYLLIREIFIAIKRSYQARRVS